MSHHSARPDDPPTAPLDAPAVPGFVERELDARLVILADEAYSDPARRDLTLADFLGLLALDVVLVTLMMLLAWM